MSFDAFNISASALYAQRVKMDTIASNIANVNTTRNPDGTPGVYKKKEVIFSTIYNQAVKSADFSSEGSIGSGGFNPQGFLQGGINNNSGTISSGVAVNEIVEDNSPPKRIYNPAHPDADKDGFVNMPNVNVVTEMVDMINASRAYEANVTTIDTAKDMMSAALRI